jgi:mannose/fructose/N-acetylgalactosamine-specific phosphotransferase system component IID
VRSHFTLLVLFSAFVSTAFAVLMKDDARAQVALGARLFGAFVVGAIVAGWLMLPFPW